MLTVNSLKKNAEKYSKLINPKSSRVLTPIEVFNTLFNIDEDDPHRKLTAKELTKYLTQFFLFLQIEKSDKNYEIICAFINSLFGKGSSNHNDELLRSLLIISEINQLNPIRIFQTVKHGSPCIFAEACKLFISSAIILPNDDDFAALSSCAEPLVSVNTLLDLEQKGYLQTNGRVRGRHYCRPLL